MPQTTVVSALEGLTHTVPVFSKELWQNRNFFYLSRTLQLEENDRYFYDLPISAFVYLYASTVYSNGFFLVLQVDNSYLFKDRPVSCIQMTNGSLNELPKLVIDFKGLSYDR